MFPAYDMQRKLQKFTLGQRYWRRLADKRLKLSNGQFIPVKKFMDLHLERLIRENKTKYQTERMLTFAKSTTIESKVPDKGQDLKSVKSAPESCKNNDILPRRMSSVNIEVASSNKECEHAKSGKIVSSKPSTIYHADQSGSRVSQQSHKGVDVTDISTDAPPVSQWVSASRSSKGGSSKKRGTNAFHGSDTYNLNVKDKSPMVYKGDALVEALLIRP